MTTPHDPTDLSLPDPMPARPGQIPVQQGVSDDQAGPMPWVPEEHPVAEAQGHERVRDHDVDAKNNDRDHNLPHDATRSSAPPVSVSSPCVRLCVLNPEGVCMGCYRTGDEIGRWGASSTAEKQQILSNVRQRRLTSTLAKGRLSR